ncbi:fungal-specific transcription factor domain-containing protein [Aspergillus germanicus]
MPVYKTSNPRKRIKSRAGCQTCKQRRIKCGLEAPACSRCAKSGLRCPGYNKVVKWSQKYEVMLPAGDSSSSQEQLLQVGATESAWFVEGVTRVEAAIAADALPAHHPHRGMTPGNQDSTTHGVRSNVIPAVKIGDPGASSSWNILFDGRYADNGTETMPYHHLEMASDKLLRYYFSRVCGILSAFDSFLNPFRVLVGNLIQSYPALRYSVLAMSAAHLHQGERDRTKYSLGHRTDAISTVARHISQGTTSDSSTTALLLSTIILGLTSTWHNVSSLDLFHLKGARALFRKYLVDTNAQFIGPDRNHPQAMFLVGVMAFWESLASFHLDQPVTVVDYLWDACTNMSDPLYPNPLTGFSTPLFIHLAKVGTLSRHLRLLKSLSSLSDSDTQREDMYSSLFVQARSLEIAVRSFVPAPSDKSPGTGDAFTPASHLQTMAQVYQLTILLELYRLFPELLIWTDYGAPSSFTSSDRKDVLVTLAINILTLLVSIADTSRTKAIQILPYLIAGSALQGSPELQSNRSVLPLNIEDPRTGIMSLSSNVTTIQYWRSITLEKISGLHAYVGLDSVDHARRIVEGVWIRADTLRPQEMVSWIDVMTDEKLSTFFG